MKIFGSMLFLSTFLYSTFAADLSIEIKNYKSDQGEVFIALWDNENGFPNDYQTASENHIIKISDKNVLTIKDLPEGKYAIAIFHDQNSDGKLNTNSVGIPKEGFGFSNNPKILFGPPSFKKAQFEITSVDKKIAIQLMHF